MQSVTSLVSVGLQMEQFKEESRVEEQRRAEAVAAREEAEQRVAELQAAAESASDAKAADAQAVRVDTYHTCVICACQAVSDSVICACQAVSDSYAVLGTSECMWCWTRKAHRRAVRTISRL